MPWKRIDELEAASKNESRSLGSSGGSSDALQALNALLSATSTNATPSVEENSADPSNLNNLLESLASFSAQINASGEGRANETQQRHEASNAGSEIASLLLAGLAGVKESNAPTADEFERYEREREEKYRELEAKFSFVSPRKAPTLPPPPPQLTGRLNLSAPVQASSGIDSIAASAREILASSAVQHFLSTFQNRQPPKETAASNQKSISHKRRPRSSSSSSTSSSATDSSSDSRSDRSGKKKKGDRKKKIKKPKSKKERQKNGKASASAKHSKLKKDQLDSERKAVVQQVITLKTNLSDYEKRRRTLEDELSRLKKQHNEMCRKLQRQKSDPKKDPLIIDNEALQSDIERHLKTLDKQKETDQTKLDAEEKRLEKMKKLKDTKKDADPGSKRTSAPSESTSPAKKTKQDGDGGVEYFDPGSHWCKHCNLVSANVFEWLEHLHSQKHKSNIDLLARPWAQSQAKSSAKNQTVASLHPFKGAEFLLPSTAFYCDLCKQFSGDSLSAEEHLKSSSHNAKYKAYVESNPFYERREMLEKAAAASQRLEKSAGGLKSIAAIPSDQKSSHRRSDEAGHSRAVEPQRVPHKPNESGKIKPFQLAASSSSSSKERKIEGKRESTKSSFAMKVDSKKPSSNSSAAALKKPHAAFEDPWDKSKRRESERHSDHKRRRDR